MWCGDWARVWKDCFYCLAAVSEDLVCGSELGCEGIVSHAW